MSLRLFFASIVIGGMSMTSANADVTIKRWNPDGLSQPDGYSQLVTVEGHGKLVLLGGKAGLRPDGSIPETLAEQSRLTWDNIDLALKAAGATREDVVEIQIFIVDLANIDPEPAYQDVRDFFPDGHKPVSMVIGVSALAIPALQIEINVRAIVAAD
ncbi:MAG: Rid family hydrolase [Rhodospirillaceae bacterium]